MRKLLLFVVSALLIGAGLVWILQFGTGYILFSFDSFTVEMSVWTGLLIYLLATAFLCWLLLTLRWVAGVGGLRLWWRRRRAARSSNLTSEGLQRFAISLEKAEATIEQAHLAGWTVRKNIIVGPDGYEFEVLPALPASSEPFEHVVLKAADPAKLAAWYGDMIGMTTYSLDGGSMRVGFQGEGDALAVGFVIEPTEGGVAPRIEQWEGRNAIAIGEKKLRAINERLKAESPELIIHEMRELHEKLGTLFIVILRDVAGYEVCLVSIETFDPSVREATNYVGPDWEARAKVVSKLEGLSAMDKARRKMVERMEKMQRGEADEDEDEDDEDEGEDEGEDEDEDEEFHRSMDGAGKEEL